MSNNGTTKILWGPITWSFFHTLAAKINNNYFIKNKWVILQLIQKICNHLPCPTCAQHATTYIKYTDPRKINNKNDLQMFFYNFHNSVNKMSKKPEFPLKNLKMYNNFNMSIVLNNFLISYPKRYGGGLNMNPHSNQLERRRTAISVYNWFKKNMQLFI